MLCFWFCACVLYFVLCCAFGFVFCALLCFGILTFVLYCCPLTLCCALMTLNVWGQFETNRSCATKYNALAPNARHRSSKYNAQPPNTISEYIHTAIQDTALNALHFHSLRYMLQLKSNYTLGILSPGQFRLKKTISLITPL